MKRLTAAVLLVLSVLGASGQADTDALTFPAPGTNVQTVGYVAHGGVGWAFVPRTNLSVTAIGAWGIPQVFWQTNDQFTFWTSTNRPLATYSAEQLVSTFEQDTNGVHYGQIPPLRLAAGQQYFLTWDEGLVGTLEVEWFELLGFTVQGWQSWPFQPATELEYGGVYYGMPGQGSLTPQAGGGSLLVLGPTFRFETLQGPPSLELRVLSGALLLAWPTNSPPCVAEMAPSLKEGAWAEVTNAPIIVGDRFFLTNSPSGPARFFRLELR
ncbi:MAG TPA: hypothetical protein VN829_00275 [Dongiaceae bacterium]|nr:hypothetical protein [Dongiaceae bacterium]